MLPQIGEVLAGKYRIEKLLGRGGMGAVFEAHHELLEQRVALKVMLADLTSSPQAVARFLNEARAAARIEGEHVVRVLDLGQLEDGAPYIALELLNGWDLARIIASRGQLPQVEAVGYVLEALEGLAQAHALGIVHRDLKPANLFVAQRRDGTQVVKVLDFGISKVTNALTGMSPNAATATSSMMGTPNYVAPEQLQSAKNVDARADIWSMGVILYELISGQTPFYAETVAQLLVAILQQAPTPLRVAQPNVSVQLERVVMRCLSQDPGARFQSVLELAEALAPHAPPQTRACVERIRRVVAGLAPASTMVQRLPLDQTVDDAFGPAASAGSVPQTRGQWTRSEEIPRPASRAAFMVSIGAGALFATILGGAGVIVLRGRPASHGGEGVASSAMMAPASPATSPSTSPPPEPDITTEPQAQTTAAPPPSPPASTPAPPAQVVPSRPSRPSPPRPPAAPATTPPPAAPSCHIVTEYDADGQPHFKKVCN